MKRKYVWHDGQFVDVTDWKRPAPKFPATGEMMDSKSRFREVTKAHGLVEVGNDCQNRQNPAADLAKDRKQDIAKAWQMVEQGYQAPPIESVSDWDGPTKLYGDT